MNKEYLVKLLQGIIKETDSKHREKYWLDREEIIQIINLEIATVLKLNERKNDGTYESIILFEGKKFVYIGRPILTINQKKSP